jgi:hypothetical protein
MPSARSFSPAEKFAGRNDDTFGIRDAHFDATPVSG